MLFLFKVLYVDVGILKIFNRDSGQNTGQTEAAESLTTNCPLYKWMTFT